MLATVPGAQQDANGNVSVGGGLPSQVQYSVDGSSTVNIRQNGALGNMNPSSELIGEFKVTQFNNNAEFAQLGDVTISTKSGTEQFHGSLFEYTQNSALDAAPWGSNINRTTLKPHKQSPHRPEHPKRCREFWCHGQLPAANSHSQQYQWLRRSHRPYPHCQASPLRALELEAPQFAVAHRQLS